MPRPESLNVTGVPRASASVSFTLRPSTRPNRRGSAAAATTGSASPGMAANSRRGSRDSIGNARTRKFLRFARTQYGAQYYPGQRAVSRASRSLVPSPQYSGERGRVRGEAASDALGERPLSPALSPEYGE